MRDHPLRPALVVDDERFERWPEALRMAVLRHFEQCPARSVGRDLGRLLDTPWLSPMEHDDRVRAIKVVATLSAWGDGARRKDAVICRRRIIDNTLDALLGPSARISLAFEDLPRESESLVAGLRRLPATVVLNRRAIEADDHRLGEGTGGTVERRTGTCTLVHEVNHLCNPTEVGPTYEAFQDEYRAWLVDFVVFADRRPRAVEGLQRCRELLTRPRYAPLAGLLASEGPRARVREFLRHFGEFEGIEDALARGSDDFETDAPLPDPPGNLDNRPS